VTLLRASVAAALLAWCAGSAAAAVQDPTLRGRVLGADGRPLAGVEVALHRVIVGGGGATIARDTTDAEGLFDLALADAGGDAILFAATRVNGRLYVGEFFRGTDAPPQYDIVAAGPGMQVPAAGTGPLQPGAPPPPPRWPLAAGVALLLGAGLALALRSARRTGPATRRRLLLEIASLDEQHAAQGDGASPEDRERYLRRRAGLYDRLRSVADRAQ